MKWKSISSHSLNDNSKYSSIHVDYSVLLFLLSQGKVVVVEQRFLLGNETRNNHLKNKKKKKHPRPDSNRDSQISEDAILGGSRGLEV